MDNIINKINHQEVLDLKKVLPISKDQISSITLVSNDKLIMTLFAIAKDQKISSHSSSGDAMVNLLSGAALITIDEQDYHLKAGESIVMPANHPHALAAIEDFQMLLVVAK